MLAGQTPTEAEGGAKAGGVPCMLLAQHHQREDLTCRACTPSLPQLWDGSGHTGTGRAFLAKFQDKQDTKGCVGIQEARRALLLTINKPTAPL